MYVVDDDASFRFAMRKALGARRKDIKRQFLLEAALLAAAKAAPEGITFAPLEDHELLGTLGRDRGRPLRVWAYASLVALVAILGFGYWRENIARAQDTAAVVALGEL